MKQIIIAGNITRDAELRTTQEGQKVASFGVAVNDRNKNATFFDVSIWGKRGESLSQYLSKGSSVTVIGDFSTQENNGKTYLKVNASEVTLQGSKPNQEGGERSPNSSPPGGYAQQSHGPSSRDLGEDIPFAPEWRG